MKRILCWLLGHHWQLLFTYSQDRFGGPYTEHVDHRECARCGVKQQLR